MTSINQLERHYDRLTARERFALIHAAGVRDDEATRAALMKASPRLRWAMPDYYGLAEGFQFLGMWYMMEQLGYVANMYWMMENSEGDKKPGRTFTLIHDGQEITVDLNEQIENIMRRILVNFVAWMRLCKEYNVDPESMLKNYPHFDTLQLHILLVDGTAGLVGESALPGEAEIQNELDNMRAVIEHYVRDWS